MVHFDLQSINPFKAVYTYPYSTKNSIKPLGMTCIFNLITNLILACKGKNTGGIIVKGGGFYVRRKTA